jgi:hypothetical protein
MAVRVRVLCNQLLKLCTSVPQGAAHGRLAQRKLRVNNPSL